MNSALKQADPEFDRFALAANDPEAGRIATPGETLELAQNLKLILTVIGLSGCGKTHFEEKFAKHQKDRFFTVSVDKLIQETPQVKVQIDELISEILTDKVSRHDNTHKWIGEITNRRPITTIEALVQTIEKSSLPLDEKNCLIDGFRQITNSQNLQLLTLFNKHFPEEYLAEEEAKTEAALRPESQSKNLFLSSTGSIIHTPKETQAMARKLSTILYILLDEEKYRQDCIDQFAGKPIAVDEKHYQGWASQQNHVKQNQIKQWTSKYGWKSNPHPDYIPVFVDWREKKYAKLSHISLNRSELEGATSDDFLEIFVRELCSKYISRLKKISGETKQQVEKEYGTIKSIQDGMPEISNLILNTLNPKFQTT